MEEKNTAHKKTLRIRRWSILVTIIIICLLVASWAIILQVTNKRTTITGATNKHTTPNGIFYVRSAVHEGGAYSSGSSNTFWLYTIHAIRLTDGATVWEYNVGKLREYQDPISEMYVD